MKLHFMGGASEVGASCALIELEGQRILVDAGVRMGAAPGGQLPNLALLDEVGAPEEVLITHAHSDHTGALPVLVPGLPGDVPLRCTAPTQAIAAVLLQDALKIMQLGEREGDLPLYAPEAVELTLARMQAVPHLVEVPICGGALRATWIPAGHILGATSIYIEGRRESLLMGGDVSMGQQQSIPGMVVPRCRPDVVVLESTYGNRRHADRAQQEAALVQQVAEAVAAGGKVLIPAFAVGRSQEVILILARAMRRGDIPAFPVWVDGMVRTVNAVYASFPDMLSPPLRRQPPHQGSQFAAVGVGRKSVGLHPAGHGQPLALQFQYALPALTLHAGEVEQGPARRLLILIAGDGNQILGTTGQSGGVESRCPAAQHA